MDIDSESEHKDKEEKHKHKHKHKKNNNDSISNYIYKLSDKSQEIEFKMQLNKCFESIKDQLISYKKEFLLTGCRAPCRGSIGLNEGSNISRGCLSKVITSGFIEWLAAIVFNLSITY